MARKLYLFSPVGRKQVDGQPSPKWVGSFTSSYAYLGDYQARLLGVGGYLSRNRTPKWLHIPAAGVIVRGGASRSDIKFSGW